MEELHVVLFPAMAHGHMIPFLDMAKLLSSRGLKTTIIATPSFSRPIIQAQNSGHRIHLITTPFPPPESPLPSHIVSFDQMTPNLTAAFLQSLDLLQNPVDDILRRLRPTCLISDIFFPWTTDSAAELGIPRIVFYGTSCFSRCVSEQMEILQPYKKALTESNSDSEPFLLPGLPHQLSFVKSQLSPFLLYEENENEFTKLFKKIKDSAKKTYGEVVNSFRELESDYFDHLEKVLGKKSWLVGPLHRGKEYAAADEHYSCSSWLDSKRPESVVYVCFGSNATFSRAQLQETAAGLEASGRDFVWVVRKSKKEEEENEDWLDLGFEERVRGKGIIVRGWAPQVMILDHPSIGAFVTHCGWNSTLEGICAGVPMVTWPLFAEQFYNEKLVTEVLGIGVSVGNKRWMRADSEGVGREAVAGAVERIMEAAEMRRRARVYKEMAKKAVEEGGSSYNSVDALIEDLRAYVPPTKHHINEACI